MKNTIAIIGCGKMGEAILSGLIYKRYAAKNRIFVSDKNVSRLNAIGKKYGVNIRRCNIDACAMCDIAIFAIKPNDIELVLRQVSDVIEDKLVISIAAGKTIDFVGQKSNAKRVVRAMPNMPALVGCAMTALSYAKGLHKTDMQQTEDIFDCIGKTVVLGEKYMDAVTAVSGSGPAYLFLLMEAMAKAAVSLGLKKDMAFKLVKQTIYGSSFLQYTLDECPAALRESVTSKDGTTEAALKVFKKKGFEKIVQSAVKAAFQRSKGLE
jgi:pyrroline-5-carboxylate reductase